MKLKTLIIAMLTALVTVTVSAESKIVLDGSTTVGPIAKAFAEYYMSQNPDVNITVSESGSGNGAKSIINGTCDIANMSRFMKDKEFKAAVEAGKAPVAHVVALDGIAMVVHPSNSISNITTQQIKDIYLGKIKNWKQLGGADQSITMVSRDTNSGTFETFNKLVMKKEKITEACEYVGSNGAVRQRIQNTKGAIGYVGIGFLDDSVKSVKVNNVEVSAGTIVSGEYAIARPLYMFTNGYPKMGSEVYKFVTLYLTQKGQEIVESIGFIPLTDY